MPESDSALVAIVGSYMRRLDQAIARNRATRNEACPDMFLLAGHARLPGRKR